MPQSLSRILIHLVFSTKNREAVLTPAIQTELHPYLAGTPDHIACPSLQVGGVADHVHLFFGLSRTRTIADVVETVNWD
jgi:putative transposase